MAATAATEATTVIPLHRFQRNHTIMSRTDRAVRTFAQPLRALAAAALLSLAAHAPALAQTVDGEVKRIDTEAGKVTLKHGEIKSIDMPAMQMAYRVADPAWLKTLQVGDKVKFDAAKVNGQFTITAITVAK